MDWPDRTSVPSHALEELTRAVERANFLNADPSRSYLLDPCCMLDALSDVYAASRRLVRESGQWADELASGSAPTRPASVWDGALPLPGRAAPHRMRDARDDLMT